MLEFLVRHQRIHGDTTLTIFPDATNSTQNRRQVLGTPGALTSDGLSYDQSFR